MKKEKKIKKDKKDKKVKKDKKEKKKKKKGSAPSRVNVYRVHQMNDVDIDTSRKGPVVLHMSRDQRVSDNWALLFTLQLAKEHGVPAVVCFNLLPKFLGATIRQYGFMLRGLGEVARRLKDVNIPFVLLKGDAKANIPKLVEDCNATALVCDFSPLRVSVQWRKAFADTLDVPVFEVDAHNVVPVWHASDKLEYAARTIRPKIHKHMPSFLTDYPDVEVQTTKWDWPDGYEDGSAADWSALVDS